MGVERRLPFDARRRLRALMGRRWMQFCVGAPSRGMGRSPSSRLLLKQVRLKPAEATQGVRECKPVRPPPVETGGKPEPAEGRLMSDLPGWTRVNRRWVGFSRPGFATCFSRWEPGCNTPFFSHLFSAGFSRAWPIRRMSIRRG
ncbi:MAG: hypothetical protein FLDDKLPJ_00848 [Phycisphaerae bacterium]|nr:hypothetical protein [Phycisphaerae bacterium]